MEKTYQIIINSKPKSDEDRWQLICDNEEILVSNILIDTRTFTKKDYIKVIGEKSSVFCTGVLNIDNGLAHISIIRKDKLLRRHLLKTIFYRILGTLTTVLVALCLGMSIEISSLLGVGELIFKPIIYFLHERIWFNFSKLKKYN